MESHDTKFQFHEGPIKTHRTGKMRRYGFSFNSMKVRLKLDFEAREHGLIMFQFHEGPIKTDSLVLGNFFTPVFQFHEGPIKTSLACFDVPMFLCFNSMKVRLKR